MSKSTYRPKWVKPCPRFPGFLGKPLVLSSLRDGTVERHEQKVQEAEDVLEMLQKPPDRALEADRVRATTRHEDHQDESQECAPPQRARGLDDRFVSLSEVLWIRLCRNSAAEAECKIRNCLAI